MDLVERIKRRSVIVLIGLSLIGLFIDYKRVPVSILIGGGLGLVNLRAIQWGVHALVKPGNTTGARGGLIFFSLLRLLAIFIILAILLKYRLINILAVLLGLTVVFIFILYEGFMETKRL